MVKWNKIEYISLLIVFDDRLLKNNFYSFSRKIYSTCEHYEEVCRTIVQEALQERNKLLTLLQNCSCRFHDIQVRVNIPNRKEVSLQRYSNIKHLLWLHVYNNSQNGQEIAMSRPQYLKTYKSQSTHWQHLNHCLLMLRSTKYQDMIILLITDQPFC